MCISKQYDFLHSLVNELVDPILVVGTDFRVKFANRAARNFLPSFYWQEGEEPFCHNIIYNSSRQCATMGRPCPLIEVVETHAPAVVEHEIVMADGVMRCYEMQASPIWAEDGSFIGIVESLRDVTNRNNYSSMLKKNRNELEDQVEKRTCDLLKSNDILRKEIIGRRRIETLLRAERDKFQTMLGAMDQGMHILNSNFEIEYQNDYLRDLFGDKLGHLCYDVYKKRTEPCEVCRMHQAIASGEVQRTEEIMRNGKHYSQSYAPFVDQSGGDKCLILLRDITKEKEYRAETMRTGQLASIGELAAGVAHEINNPLNGIINFSQILMDDSDSEEDQDLLARIIKEGERVSTIVSKLLNFARQGGEDDSLLETDVVLAIEDSVILINHQLKKDGIRLEFNVDGVIPSVLANGSLLQQVFINLLSNGRHALKTKYKDNNQHPDNRFVIDVTVVTVEGREFVRASFTDHGGGIPADIIEKVCNPFFSTKQPGEGTGLGLSISEGIIAKFDGLLHIKSEIGEYTTVQVDLPVLVVDMGGVESD